MPRQARKKSNSGIYHIMLREINGQQLFADSDDYEKFLEIFKDCKAISEFEIFAYCLMGNHIHLLLKRKVYKKIHAKGISIRQISRLCGETKGFVEKCLR